MAAAKRARTASGAFAGAGLTGGTGDVKPQYLTVSTPVASAINEYAVAVVALPVARFGAVKDRATVMEILGVDWYLGIQDVSDGNHLQWAFLSTVTDRTADATSTSATCAEDAQNPLTLAMAFQNLIISGGSGGHVTTLPVSIDTTDGAGNGILIATDRLSIVFGASANFVAGNAVAKIKYRLVNVGIAEYVGIVQSQQ